MRAMVAIDVRRELETALERDAVHGAYLFHGPGGTGKRASAFWLARLLLARPAGEDEALEPFWHPDLHALEPEKGILRVDQVRELMRALSLVANEGGRRVGLVLGAERMRVEAANALLKTLEEPPAGACLVLVSTSAAALPPTIRSRTTEYRFAPETEQAVAEALRAEGMDEDDAALAAALGGGSSDAAGAWAEANLEQAREIRGALQALARGSASDALDFAESFRGAGAAGRARAELFCEVHTAVSRERVLEAVRSGDAGQARIWLDRAEAAQAARRELGVRNLNPQLVVEGLLLDLRS